MDYSADKFNEISRRVQRRKKQSLLDAFVIGFLLMGAFFFSLEKPYLSGNHTAEAMPQPIQRFIESGQELQRNKPLALAEKPKQSASPSKAIPNYTTNPGNLVLKNLNDFNGNGNVHIGTITAMKLTQKILGDNLKYFTAVNDPGHSTGQHPRGLAFDVVLKDGRKAEAAKTFKRLLFHLRKYGDIRGLDEYNRKSRNWTGKHFHFGFGSPQTALSFHQNFMAGKSYRATVKSKKRVPGKYHIEVSISQQRLRVIESFNHTYIKSYRISTSKFGLGNQPGSYKTPLGAHKIAGKTGEGAPLLTIFKGGVSTGKQAPLNSGKDYVTTRVIFLAGLEDRNSNSRDRRIYIHGTPSESLIGQPASYGCIRMLNKDIVELYNFYSDVHTKVFIEE